MTYREKAIKLIQERLQTDRHVAIEIIDLLDINGEYMPCALGILNAPDDLEDWDVEIEEKNQLIQTYTSSDSGGEYKHTDIIDYDHCCMCSHFYDNEYEEKFECLNTHRKINEDCFDKF